MTRRISPEAERPELLTNVASRGQRKAEAKGMEGSDRIDFIAETWHLAMSEAPGR